MSSYIALIHKDPNSDFGVSFPDLPGCITAGADLDIAREMADEALALHLAGMVEDGKAIPQPSSLETVMADIRNLGAVAILIAAPDQIDPALGQTAMARSTNADPVPLTKKPVEKNIEEAVKLTGTFVNSIAVGIVITGGIAPAFAFLNGLIPDRIEGWQVLCASAVCLIAASGLHFAARRYVRQELVR